MLDNEHNMDSELVIRARRGDEYAWEDLVHQHQQAVFRLAYLQLGDQDDAADIAQETFIRAYRALGRFDTERPLRPWLLRIATNLVRNRWRFLSRYRKAVERLIVKRDLGQGASRPIDGQLGEFEPLWQAINRLDHKDREVIYLRYFLEMSVRESAESLGVAEGTIKSRTHRALSRLREALDG